MIPEAKSPTELLPEPYRSLIDTVADHLHSGQRVEAARLLMKATETPGRAEDEKTRDQVFQGMLMFCLSNNYYVDASRLCWPNSMFFSRPVPFFTQLVWDALHDHDGIMLQGGASTSKTYSCGVYFLLDWVRDPDYTTVRVAGPSEMHLQDNLFSHLVHLHTQSAIKLPGRIGDLFIGMDLRNRRSAISGVVFPLGKRPAGRLQGTKRFPRAQAHPQFGILSRLRVLLDEVEHMPPGVWSDLDNVLANTDPSEGHHGLKIASAYNPKNPAGPCGVRAEPVKGHQGINPDKDFTWVSKRGWFVVRLDGEQCENVLEKKVRFPGLQTFEGLEKLAVSSGGRASPNYQTFGRAMFPKEGAQLSVVPATFLVKARGRFIWADRPRRVGGGDLALQGGDNPVLAIGDFGMALGVEYPPDAMHAVPYRVMFTSSAGQPITRLGLQLESLYQLPHGDSMAMARAIKKVCYDAGIDPVWLCLDRTGHGTGVYDILREIWHPGIIGINFSESSTMTKILEEDTQFCHDIYDRIDTEIWFALSKWLEFDLLKISPAIDSSLLFQQFSGRFYAPGLKSKVEPKKEFKARNQGKSPDEAESVCLMVHAVRMASGVTPTGMMRQEKDPDDEGADDAVRVDVTNRASSDYV